ncbi:MAG TPA: DUF4382 domain-containing protein [Puia sp.]|uniref:DUF4382 domain-containing protein n=1 Tax=Puia sp. TaxID=2045100 RepID=UPI002CCF199B|nr:DUF4382 domain-containing protein [Puia sp.]HVU99358.1 DUF4382 domain-containing protein [Puia sp.]
MKTVTKWLAAATGATAVLVFAACHKSNSSDSNPNIPKGQSQVSIYMMDGPADYTKVLIDIRQVAVEIDTASKQNDADHDDQWDDSYCGEHRTRQNSSVIWDTLNITPGVYDLLQLRNGTDTLLASGLYSTGKILKIRVTLGSDNTIYTDSTTHYPLEIFGPSPSFTINVGRTNVQNVTNNEFKLWLDFNLGRSIFFWSGTFYLKPFFVVFNDMVSSKVQGTVLPPGAGALVTGTNGADTIYAVPFGNGAYKFRGVPAGTWSFNFKGRNGYQDTTILNIKVDSMKTVKLPTITLHR